MGRKLAYERLAEDEPEIGDRLPEGSLYSFETIAGDWLPARPWKDRA
jgi:hypothetical protein